jgi:hypothetical protein
MYESTAYVNNDYGNEDNMTEKQERYIFSRAAILASTGG